VTAAAVSPAYGVLAVDSWLRRVGASLRTLARRGVHFRLRCLILGHEDSFGREPHRLMLRCTACGRETVGWPIGRSTSGALAPPRMPPGRATPTVETALRVGPWALHRKNGRSSARERQRQRLVAAASRAAEGPRKQAG
jgi:hypothetical protein